MPYSWERKPVGDAVAYTASLPDATPYGRFPGMPSLRSCIPRLLYLQTSSTGCHIPIFGIYPSSIDGYLPSHVFGKMASAKEACHTVTRYARA